MLPDQPPMNRAARRAAAHKKAPPVVVRPFRRQSQSAAPDPATPTGDPSEASSAEDDTMAAPAAERSSKVSHHKGGGKLARIREGLLSYYGFAGMLITARNPADGMLIISRAEELTDAHLQVAKINPGYMRVLELLTMGGPYTALILIHGKLAVDLLANHGRSPLELLQRTPREDTAASPDGQHGAGAAPPPLPYQPAGPFAPTDNTPPPMPPVDDSLLRVWPDEELPADMERELRQLAKQTGRPYNELRNEIMLALAQERMAQNGHMVAPGALGAPVARE